MARGVGSAASGSEGCDGPTGSVTVSIQSAIAVPVIMGNTALCEGDMLVLTVSGVVVNGFTWTTPSGPMAGTALVFSAAATVGTAGTYTVHANGGECPDVSASIEVTVEECGIIIPNVFTPNGDGSNDYFVVEGTALTSFEFHVFNRWGQEVYSSQAASIAWNGRGKGSDALPDGVYYYELNEMRSGKNTVHTGYIQLTRGR